MILFLLPGFGSQNPNFKFKTLVDNIPEVTVVGLSYDTYDPKFNSVKFMVDIENCKEFYNDDDIHFIGTSLGALWANILATQYDTTATMINPCVDPYTSLRSHIGLSKNDWTNSVITLTENWVDSYAELQSFDNDVKRLLLFDEGDEVFDYNETIDTIGNCGNIVIYEGGSHRFEHLMESIPIIRNFIGLKDV